jgi:integrase/recombinase XerD
LLPVPKIDRHPLRRVRLHVKATLTLSLSEACAYHQFVLESLGRGPVVRQGYARVITRYIHFLETTGRSCQPSLTDLTVDNARAFLIWLKTEHETVNPLTNIHRKKGPRTIRDAANTLKIFSKFCMTENLTETNRLDRFQLPKAGTPVIETFTPLHCQELLIAASRTMLATRNIAIIYALLATGIRADEACQLTMADLDVQARRARIQGKGGKQRWVYFDPTTTRILSRYLATRGKIGPHAPVFVQDDGTSAMRPRSLWRVIHLIGEAAGVQGVRCSPHTFRHTFAVTWLRTHSGALFHLQLLLGHESLEMVRRYARLAESEAPLDGPSPVEVLLGTRRG